MTLAYHPQNRKAVLTTLRRRKTPKDTLENAQDLFQTAGITEQPVRYYIPQESNRDESWETFREYLTHWRKKPFLVAQVVWNYLQALHDERTNLRPSEFILLALEATHLELTDFTVNHLTETNKLKTSSKGALPDSILPPVEDKAPLAIENRPLIVEILNGSGIKGAALELTQFLRDQNQKGQLNVDVLQYDNYPGERQKNTYIIDYTGRRAQIKQLSTAIGINNEIVSDKQANSICDICIVIGEDFKQPL